MTAPMEHPRDCDCLECEDRRFIAEDVLFERTADAGGWG
jgi:hypothetical protein